MPLQIVHLALGMLSLSTPKTVRRGHTLRRASHRHRAQPSSNSLTSQVSIGFPPDITITRAFAQIWPPRNISLAPIPAIAPWYLTVSSACLTPCPPFLLNDGVHFWAKFIIASEHGNQCTTLDSASFAMPRCDHAIRLRKTRIEIDSIDIDSNVSRHHQGHYRNLCRSLRYSSKSSGWFLNNTETISLVIRLASATISSKTIFLACSSSTSFLYIAQAVLEASSVV